MLARNALLFKWSVYLGTMLLAVLLQTLVLEHLIIAGVFPFIYPALVAVMATYEAPLEASVYGLILGVLCDILLHAPISCLYTLLFPTTAFLCTIISKNLLKAGFLCSGVCTILSFFLSGVLYCLIFTAQGQDPWVLGMAITAQELALSFVLIVPLTLAFRFIQAQTRHE